MLCLFFFLNLYWLQLTFSLRQAKGETDLLLSNTHVNVVSRWSWVENCQKLIKVCNSRDLWFWWYGQSIWPRGGEQDLGWLTKASSMITAKSGSEVRGREGLKTFYAHVLLPYKCSSLNNFKIFIFFFPPGSSSPLLLNQWIVFTSFIHSIRSHHSLVLEVSQINLYFIKSSDFAIIWLLPEPFRKRSVN